MGDLAQLRVCVTGGAGFLGRFVCAKLRDRGVHQISAPRSAEFDLTREGDVSRVFEDSRPDVLIHLAAEVGGIGANQRHPGRFFYANMVMGLLLMEEARRRNIAKFVQVGSVCAYPKFCPTPFREEDLWNGYPEETNAPYGIAKRALSVMLEGYHQEYGFNGVYLIPANLYGPGDHFDPESSHVIPAMIRRFCEAADRDQPAVVCWGTGSATREFLFVEDAAEAIVRAAEMHNDPKPLNLGTGEEISIADLAGRIARLCGFTGRIEWDPARPDGQPRRRIDTSRAAQLLRWKAATSLDEGLRQTLQWWRAQNRSTSRDRGTRPQSVAPSN